MSLKTKTRTTKSVNFKEENFCQSWRDFSTQRNQSKYILPTENRPKTTIMFHLSVVLESVEHLRPVIVKENQKQVIYFTFKKLMRLHFNSWQGNSLTRVSRGRWNFLSVNYVAEGTLLYKDQKPTVIWELGREGFLNAS